VRVRAKEPPLAVIDSEGQQAYSARGWQSVITTGRRCLAISLFFTTRSILRARSSAMRFALLFLCCCALIRNQAPAQEPSDQAANEAAIRKAAGTYADAFNKRDAQALADHWSPDAVYINRTTGEQVVGRDAISRQFKDLFEEQPGLKVEVNVASVQFVSPNVAIEQGTTRILSPTAEPEEIDYSAVNVKRDGKWVLDRVTDKSKEVIPSHREQLKPLEWMVGSWTHKAGDAEVEVDCNWTKNKNFLTRTFKIAIPDQADFSGLQVIGWDPAAKTVRSWTFDANGTFAEATWEHRGGRWFIRNRGTLPDGRAATMVNVMKPVGENSFTWQTIDRTAGSELLPSIDEILLVRQ
jgi:uncharacterized protein (TIGR02246 family)